MATNETMNLLGIDYGTKRVGIAISVGDTVVPCGDRALPNDKNIVDEILKIVKQRNIKAIIIGDPVELRNASKKELKIKKGPFGQRFQKFTKKLEKSDLVSIKYVDEKWTSRIADELLEDKNKDKKKGINDQLAACEILQTYLRMYKSFKNKN